MRRDVGPGTDARRLCFRWTFLTELDETLELIRSFESPQVKLLFDAYHLGHLPGIAERLPELSPWIALVQLGDAKVPPCGEQNRCRLGAARCRCGRLWPPWSVAVTRATWTSN